MVNGWPLWISPSSIFFSQLFPIPQVYALSSFRLLRRPLCHQMFSKTVETQKLKYRRKCLKETLFRCHPNARFFESVRADGIYQNKRDVTPNDKRICPPYAVMPFLLHREKKFFWPYFVSIFISFSSLTKYLLWAYEWAHNGVLCLIFIEGMDSIRQKASLSSLCMGSFDLAFWERCSVVTQIGEERAVQMVWQYFSVSLKYFHSQADWHLLLWHPKRVLFQLSQ